MLPNYGILELLAQSVEVTYPFKRGNFVGAQRRRLRCPPCFVESSTGSNVFAAIEEVLPHFSLDALLRHAQSGVKFVCILMNTDLASSLVRLKCELLRRICEHNRREDVSGYVMLLSIDCGSHVLHREIEAAFSTHELIPFLYSVSFSLSLPDAYSSVARHLEDLVREDLSTNFFPGLEPPSREHQLHTATIASVVLLRADLARVSQGANDSHAKAKDMLADFIGFFNGNTAAARIEHFCYHAGCCSSVDGRLANSGLHGLHGNCSAHST